MTNQAQSSKSEKKFDLEERTAEFGEKIIGFIKKIPSTHVNNPLICQTVRAATSIGANYMEANGAESKKDFIHKMSICKKEAKETMHWVRMIAAANTDLKKECRIYWKEAHELALIFGSITKRK